jgi:hypothetical protein
VTQFTFRKSTLPMTLRVAGVLVFVQAMVLFLAGLFVVLAGTVLGSGSSVSFAGLTLSGGPAAGLGVAFIALSAAAFYLSAMLTRRVPWSRSGLVGLEALLIVLFLARGELSVNLAVNVLLCVVVSVLLVTPSAGAAFATSREPDSSKDTSGTSALRSP